MIMEKECGVNLSILHFTQEVTGLAAGDSVKSWKSSKTSIVKVNSKGKITAQKKTGKAKITVTLASGLKKTITVTVQKKTVTTKKITGVPSKLKLKKKKTYQLAVILNPLTSSEKVTYKTSNKKVVTVSKSGKLTAKKAGSAVITVKSGKITKKCKVTVK